MAGGSQPILSVVVAIVCDTLRRRTDTAYLEGTLAALAQQVDPPAMEVLVPYHPGISGIEQLQRRFPRLRWLPISALRTYAAGRPGREHHDELRALGIAAARGQIVALVEDHGRPDARWCANLVKAHQRGYDGVGGAIENGIDRSLNWAVYFCDFGAYQNPVRAGETAMISDANASYKREVLERIRDIWRDGFHQVVVNEAIRRGGGRLGLFPDIVVRQYREGLKFGEALAERYVWGRSFAASRCRWIGRGEPILRAALAPLLPAVLTARMAAAVLRKGRLRRQFAAALPLILLLEMSWSLGELTGYVSGVPFRAD